jgi:hypothetical protein
VRHSAFYNVDYVSVLLPAKLLILIIVAQINLRGGPKWLMKTSFKAGSKK